MPTRINWQRRRTRAEKLRSEHPHAAELLAFYEQVLALQEPLYQRAAAKSWTVRAAAGGGAGLDLNQLAGREIDRLFRRFARDLQPAATEVLAPIAGRLAAFRSPAGDLLRTFLGGGSLDALAADLGCEPSPLEFFPQAFLQPLIEAAAEKRDVLDGPAEPPGDDDVPAVPGFPARCPHCRRPPLVGLLEDEPEAKGGRHLVCSLCSTAWRFLRATCPACGETRAQQLRYHETDDWPHLRVEECTSCRTYLKTVDLRTDGLAVPAVDELASVELDLWADGQGLGKLQRNLLGL